MNSNIQLSITFLCGGALKTETISSLLDNLNTLPFRKTIGFVIGGYPAYSRNAAVVAAIKNKSTHLMFIDADQTFPPDGVKRLLEQKKQIIGANYNQRSMPLISTVKMMNDKGEMIGQQGSLQKIPLPDKTFKAYAIGTGFMLLDLSIFKKIKKPWFNTEVWFEGEEPKYKTEDIYFCENARKAGYDIWCDPTIKVGHIGEYIY